MTIGQRIKYYRTERGLSQEELAKILDTTKQTICKYEKQTIINIPISKIETMAALFCIEPTELMGWNVPAKENTNPSESGKDSNNQMTEISHDEIQLLTAYRKLNKKGKFKAIDYANDLAKSTDYTETPPRPHRVHVRGVGIVDITEEEYKKLEKAIQDLPDANDLDYL